MIAAIYARKSTEQTGVADEQKSVSRQIEHARRYAERKGWTVDDASVFVDDGISGAEFANRPGFLRLMNSLKPRPRFQVLVMSEESRLGREMIETSYALKLIVTAGVRVFYYMEDRERCLETPTDKILLAVSTYAGEVERELARARAIDAATRRARAGHVTGGQCFGYRNVDVTTAGADGRQQRQYVRREIVQEDAATVRRIFELCARGEGLKSITKVLNADRVPAPRSQQARPRAWAPSSVREVLHRETYRGVVVWNKTKKRDGWGHKKPSDRPTADWMRIPAEDLRIVSDVLWQAAHGRLTERRIVYRQRNPGEPLGAPEARGARQSYLLSGFARCAVCGGSMQAVSRPSTTGRLFRYVCGTYVNRGETLCGNRRMAAMMTADTAIRALLAQEVLRPAILEAALDRAVEMLRSDVSDRDRGQRRATLSKQLAAVELALANLADTAARNGAVPAVLDLLSRKDTERRAIVDELQTLRHAGPATVALEPRALRRELRKSVDAWQEMTRDNVGETRGLLETVLRSRIVFRPMADATGAPMYELTVPIQFDRLLVAAVPSLQRVGGTSPTGTADGWPLPVNGFSDLRAA